MSALETFASHLGPYITRYLALKRALGRRYANERDIFMHLDRFLATNAHEERDLSPETFARWCATLTHLKPGVRRGRMRVVRNLCLFRQRSDPRCFVPDPSGFPQPHPAYRPYCFTEQDIVALLRATDDLGPHSRSPLRGEVLRLAVVLLFTAGLRRGELVRLTLGDYDPAEQTLQIRATKFHKSRLVPLSPDAAREMETYLCARRRLPHAADAPLLCSRRHGLRSYTGEGLCRALSRLFRRAGVLTPEGRPPRVHDMRHSFALTALRRWYRAGLDVQTKLPALAAYMGHVSIASTQYYLAYFEPFAEAASERFALHCESVLTSSTVDVGAP